MFHVPEDTYGSLQLVFDVAVGRDGGVLDTIAPNYSTDAAGAISYVHTIRHVGGCKYLDSAEDDTGSFGFFGTESVASIQLWAPPTPLPTVPPGPTATLRPTLAPAPTETPGPEATISPTDMPLPAPNATPAPSATPACPTPQPQKHL